MKLFLPLILSFLLLACKQDPLDGFDKSVKKAQTPTNSKTNPTRSDALVIDVNDSFDIQEGEELSFKISGRVLVPNSTFTIEIKNSEAFPGMTYDQKTGNFSWKVPTDFVRFGDKENLYLNLQMLTNEAPYRYEDKTVFITVFRSIARPEIVSVASLPVIEEGNTEYFNVVVRSADENTQPRLNFIVNNSGASAASFLSLYSGPTRDANDPALWTFSLRIDVPREVTESSQTLYYGLQVFSSLGLESMVSDQTVEVITNLSNPVTTWDTATVYFVAGEKKIFTFNVYDPSFEGEVVVDSNEICSPLNGAACSCSLQSRGVMNCEIQWTPSIKDVGNHNANFTIKNILPLNGQVLEESESISRSIQVIK